jgi:branched-chain amino acid transport system permease protein
VGLKELVMRFTTYWMLCFGIVLLVILLGFRGGVVGTLVQRLTPRKQVQS